MALSIDSHAVLRAIADNPDAFPAVQTDLDGLARKMLGKQLKAKSTDAVLFKKIYDLTGETNMSSILDNYAANDLVALLRKIDPHCPHAKTGGNPKDARSHIADLAAERVQPSAKPERVIKARTPKAPKPERPKIGGVLESKVHSGKTRTSRTKKTI